MKLERLLDSWLRWKVNVSAVTMANRFAFISFLFLEARKSMLY